MSWHMSEKVMVGVIIGLASSLVLSLGQALYISKTLDTTPPIVERVRVLELQTSEMGKTMKEIKNLLVPLNDTMQLIHREQSRRKPMVDFVEKEMGRHSR